MLKDCRLRIIHGILNASWKICFLVVNGQSFLVIDGYLQNLFERTGAIRHGRARLIARIELARIDVA